MGDTAQGQVRHLVSFDVDGTLIRSVGARANHLHKAAFAAAWKAVLGLDTHIDVVAHHGSTDPLILVKVAAHHGVPKADAMAALPALQAAMVDHFLANAADAGEGLEVLPGVRPLLAALAARPDVAVCLVTGNLEPIAWAKMEALGLAPLFSAPRFGGFGSDFCSGDVDESWRDRAQLVRVAAARCAARRDAHPAGLAARAHVGDAPMDVRAAADAGAAAVGVTTGIYTRAELEAAAPAAVVLDGLHSLDEVLAACGLLPAAAAGGD